MKKSNVITLITLVLLIVMVLQMLYLWQESSSKPQDDFKVSVEDYDVDLDEFDNKEPDYQTEVPATEAPTIEPSKEPEEEATPAPEAEATIKPTVVPTDKPSKKPEGQDKPTKKPNKNPTNKPTKNPTSKPTNKPVDTPNKDISPTMKGALFIGDSRTVGLMEYAGIEEADFFATVGMSVYNIYKNNADVAGIGEISLTELLDTNTYDKIYLMLGINEVGYKIDPTIKKYGELISFIKEKEPGAVVFVQANIHVSKERSDVDKVINNKALNNFNANIKTLANNKDIFYLDVNPLFDDEEGNLSTGASGDGVHLYAKYYEQWGQWLERQTSRIVEKYF